MSYQLKTVLTSCLIALSILSTNVVCYSQNKPYGPYGEVFTPRGDLRVLVVCVGFENNDYDQPFSNWPPHQDLPDYMQDGNFFEAFYDNFDQFEQFKNDSSVQNISKLYQEMSQPNENFRIVADVFPRRINISPAGANRMNCWSLFNKRALQQLLEEEPQFDWSPYDNRKNRPNFLFDNSQTGPDGKPDFIIFYYRYDPNWKKELFKNARGCAGDGGGGSRLWGAGNFNFGNYQIDGDGFFVTSSATKSPEGFIKLFKHELGHELFSGPHYMGANGAIGNYFNLPITGWGSTVTTELLNNTINAWERWLMGWIDIKHDLSDISDNGTYLLRDFASTGDAIRIKIPNSTNEYLWIENHQQKSVFDASSWSGKLKDKPKGSYGIPAPEKGLYMFTEAMVSDRNAISTRLVSDMQAVNGAHPLNAQGNYDYDHPLSFTKTEDWSEYWNGKMYHFNRTTPNPYAGLNPFMQYRADFDSNGVIKNSGNFNGAKTESVKIVKEYINGELRLVYGNHGGRNEAIRPTRRSDAFQVGDVLNMSSNPPVFHRPKFNIKTDKLNAINMNGLEIEVISQDGEGNITVQVKFNNSLISNDLRITGFVQCNPVLGAKDGIDYLIDNSVELSVNRSGIPNHLKKDSTGFVHASVLSFQDSSRIFFSKKSSLKIDESSMVTVNKGSSLSFGKRTTAIIKDKSKLIVASGCHLTLHWSSRLSISDNSEMTLEQGVIFNGKQTKEQLVITDTDSLNSRRIKRKVL